MHYYIYPKGNFGRKIKEIILFNKDTYSFIDDSIEEMSLENFVKEDENLNNIILSSPRYNDKLIKNLNKHNITDFIDGEIFYEECMKTISEKGLSSYWAAHTVANSEFESAKESLEYFHWRNRQYLGYIDLMPTNKQDGKIVLDYGCGPGNDLVGFSTYSNVKELIGIDISEVALSKANTRLKLHNKSATLIKVDENMKTGIPLESNSVDYIHCSGVLMHTLDITKIIKEFYRILKPNGEFVAMVYNKQSIWYHLYAAYIWKESKPKYRNMDTKDVFPFTTDGEHCPVSGCYEKKEFLDLISSYGFEGKFTGAAISLSELIWLPKIYEALKADFLKSEHADFLMAMTYDNKNIPYFNGDVAGIDACFKFKKV